MKTKTKRIISALLAAAAIASVSVPLSGCKEQTVKTAVKQTVKTAIKGASLGLRSPLYYAEPNVYPGKISCENAVKDIKAILYSGECEHAFTNTNGNKGISIGEHAIVYDKASDCLIFVQYTSANSYTSGSQMNFYTPDDAVECTVLMTNDDSGTDFVATASFLPSKYKKTDLDFSIQQSGTTDYTTAVSKANEYFRSLMEGWDALLGLETGYHLEDIGFTSFN